METEKPTAEMCSVIAMDHSSFCYRVCSICEKTLSDNFCNSCNFNAFNPGCSPSKHLYRVLLSIGTDTKVRTVICFDKATRVLFGCSADEFLEFSKLHPFAAETASEILEGEMFIMKFAKPKNGNARHSRVVQVVPLSSSFRPVIATLRELYE